MKTGDLLKLYRSLLPHDVFLSGGNIWMSFLLIKFLGLRVNILFTARGHVALDFCVKNIYTNNDHM